MHSFLYIPDPIVTGSTDLLPRCYARRLERLPCNSEIMGSNPTLGRTQGFDLNKFRYINFHDILTSEIFVDVKCSCKLVGFRVNIVYRQHHCKHDLLQLGDTGEDSVY